MEPQNGAWTYLPYPLIGVPASKKKLHVKFTPFFRCGIVSRVGSMGPKVSPKHDAACLVQRHVSGSTYDGTAAKTWSKPESHSTTALIAEVKHLKAEVERLQTANIQAEVEIRRLKAKQNPTFYQDAVCEWMERGGDVLYGIRLEAVA